MELDYKKMFETLQKIVANKAEQEERFFRLARECNELTPYTNKIRKVLMELSMADQIKVFECTVRYGNLCKHLVEKYGFDDDVEITE